MSTVYLVASGDYSDYSVDAAFSNEAAAEACAKRIGGHVDARELYDTDPPPHLVYIFEYGTGAARHPRQVVERTIMQEGWEGDGPFIGKITRGVGRGHYAPDEYRYWGRDRKRVSKAFYDHHAQREAIRAGVADDGLLIFTEEL